MRFGNRNAKTTDNLVEKSKCKRCKKLIDIHHYSIFSTSQLTSSKQLSKYITIVVNINVIGCFPSKVRFVQKVSILRITHEEVYYLSKLRTHGDMKSRVPILKRYTKIYVTTWKIYIECEKLTFKSIFNVLCNIGV